MDTRYVVKGRGLCIVLAATFILPGITRAQAPDQQQMAMHYSLYYEDFKNENWESAVENLRWILQNAPSFPRNNDRNFERATEIYREIGVLQEDEALQRTYLDSALMIFDTAVTTLQGIEAEVDEFEWALEKGKFIQENADYLPDLQDQIADQYMIAYNLEPERLQAYYLNYIIADYVRAEEKDAAVTFLEELEVARGTEAEIVQLLDQWRATLFTSPQERYDFISSKLELTPDDAELILEKFELAMDLEYRDDVYELANRVLELDPTEKTYRLVGKMKLDDGEAQEAYELFERALELAETADARRDIYFNMGIGQQQMGRLSRARTHFRQSIQQDDTFGQAYMAIGDLYVTAVAECGSFEREDRAVYWLVTDYYDRARSVDPSVAAAAQRKSRQYRAYYPDQEALFFKGWTPGQRYQIDYGCYEWIQEPTSVKSP
jgi:tetratricopeptide (TPR) repeat protein